MMETIFIALATLILHPLVYIGIIIMAISAVVRVKQERNSFHTRVYAKRAEYIVSFFPSLLAGISASVILLALGMVFPVQLLVLVGLASATLLLTGQLSSQSPIYIMSLATVFLICLPYVSLPTWMIVSPGDIPPYASIMAFTIILLLVHAGLIYKNGAKLTSPQIEEGKRGRFVGIHRIKRLWIVPLVLFIPEGMIPSFTYWPVFNVNGAGLQPIILPFIFGFGHTVRSLPSVFITNQARKSATLAAGLVVPTVFMFFFQNEWLFLATLGGALMVQIGFHLSLVIKSRTEAAFFTEEQRSCKVVGVLPGSPAEKMAIQIGEEVVRVNGQTVSDETSLYKALQVNPVYCKLEVKDLQGEKRFVKGPLYSGEHYQLGVLLVRKREKLSDSVI